MISCGEGLHIRSDLFCFRRMLSCSLSKSTNYAGCNKHSVIHFPLSFPHRALTGGVATWFNRFSGRNIYVGEGRTGGDNPFRDETSNFF